METRSAKRKRLSPTICPDCNEDRISGLPNDILDHLLSLLPIRSIVRTSVLSKRWKNLWYSFRNLDLTTINVNKLAKIQNLLETHSDIRVLKFFAFLTVLELDTVIRHATRHNVQEFDIEVSTHVEFYIPRSLLRSGMLQTLRLKSYPGFWLPSLETMKDSFRSLSSLSLARAILRDPVLVSLFTASSFPLLKKLHLEDISGLKHLRIESPALEDLTLVNCFEMQNLEICVQKLRSLRVLRCFLQYSIQSASVHDSVYIDAPTLRSLFWSSNPVTREAILHNFTSLEEAYVGYIRIREDLSAPKVRSVSNFLSGISNCHSLTLGSHCIEILSRTNLSEGFSLSNFDKLKSLELSTGLRKHNNPGLACLFKKISSTIHTITIKIIGDDDNDAERRQLSEDSWDLTNSEEERYWESQAQDLEMESFLHHLKVLRIHGFSECANSISLIKFLLKHGKVLEQLFLSTTLSKTRDSRVRRKIKSLMMGFSSEANLVV